MTKYFTKEYIKECDCPEIRGLKNKDWQYILPIEKDRLEIKPLYLPTGDQLDEEIVKICGEDYRNYTFEYSLSDDNEKIYDYKAVIQYYTPDIDPEDGVENYLAFYEHDTNPLIAKIKLLKALLKENKKC